MSALQSLISSVLSIILNNWWKIILISIVPQLVNFGLNVLQTYIYTQWFGPQLQQAMVLQNPMAQMSVAMQQMMSMMMQMMMTMLPMMMMMNMMGAMASAFAQAFRGW